MDFLGDDLPPQFLRHEKIVKSILNEKKLSIKDKLRDGLKIFFLTKSLYYNEKSKYWISKFNRKRSPLEENRDTVMFLAHTNAILFDKFDEFEVDRVESVVKEVREDPSLQEYISIIDPLSHNSLLKLLKYPNLVYRFIDPEIQKKAKENSHNLNKKWKNLRDNLKFDPIERGIFEYFKPALDFYFSREVIYLIILYYEMYKKVLREQKIKLLCLYSTTKLIIKCAIASADKLKIKTLHIFHGFGMPTLNSELPNSVYYAVPGEKYKEKLINLKVKPENIFITGPVFMDYIPQFLEKIPSKKDKKRILIATQPLVEEKLIEKKKYFDYVNRYLNSLSELEVDEIVIKLHPRERYINSYRAIINSLDSNKIRLELDQKKQTLYSLLSKSDVLITFFSSTVTIESMHIDVPTLTVDLVEYNNPDLIMDNTEEIIHMKPDDDISKIVNKILYDKDFREDVIRKGERFTREYLYKVDGKSGKRTSRLIKNLIPKG